MLKRTNALVAAMLIALTSSAFAQVATTGTIQIVVADKDGGRLPGVTVTAAASDSITKRTVVTDTTGTALLEALAPSSQYRVTVMLPGFADLVRSEILVRSGQTVSLSLTMQVAGLTEAVQVGPVHRSSTSRARRPVRTSPCASPSRCPPAVLTRATSNWCQASCRTARPRRVTLRPARG